MQKQDKLKDNDIILEIKDLHTYFYNNSKNPVKAVEGINLTLYKKEVLGIVGESGCGKSLTARSILKILPTGAKIAQGSIFFNGEDILTLKQKRLNEIRGKMISMIFQEPSSYLNPVLTVGFQVSETYTAHFPNDKKNALKKTIQIFKEVGIPDPSKRIKNYPHELSGGQKQRVMTAMALINNPDIIIADEPTTSLDVTVQAQIIKLFKDLLKNHSSSIIFITHDLPLVSEIADRIMVMYAGMNVEEAPTKELISKPLHPYTKSLLESIPPITEKWQKLKTIEGQVPDPSEKPAGCPFHPRCIYAEKDCSTKKTYMIEVENSLYNNVCSLL